MTTHQRLQTRRQQTRLRAARTEAGLPQDQMARKLQISPSLYGELETGRLIPTERVRNLLEAAFNEPIGKLLGPMRGRTVPKMALSKPGAK